MHPPPCVLTGSEEAQTPLYHLDIAVLANIYNSVLSPWGVKSGSISHKTQPVFLRDLFTLWLRYLGQVTYPGVLFCKIELTLMLTRLIFPANEKTCKAAQISENAVDDHLHEWVP